jgi:DNA-binding NarL/FixJ family response regulator
VLLNTGRKGEIVSRARQNREPAEPLGIRVLVVEDHPIVSHGIVRRLRDGGVDVVGECTTGQAALELFADLAPDLMICDLQLGRGNMTGVDVVRKLRADRTDARVIIFSAHDDEQSISSALDAGAIGYVQKSVDASELLACVRDAFEGQNVFDKATSGKVIAALRSRGRGDKVRLSPREHEVLELMTRGVTSTKGIAETLFISQDTAKTHVERMMAKLEVSDRASAVAKAFRERLVTLDS